MFLFLTAPVSSPRSAADRVCLTDTWGCESSVKGNQLVFLMQTSVGGQGTV